MKKEPYHYELSALRIAISVIISLIAIYIISSLSSCTPDRDECGKADTTRCHDNTVETCTTGGDWLPDSQSCDVLYMLDGSTETGRCIDNGLAECVISDGGA